MKYACSMETVQQNGRFTLFSSKFPSNIYSILFAYSISLLVNSCKCTVWLTEHTGRKLSSPGPWSTSCTFLLSVVKSVLNQAYHYRFTWNYVYSPFKWTVSVILSDPSSKDGCNILFRTRPLEALSDQVWILMFLFL